MTPQRDDTVAALLEALRTGLGMEVAFVGEIAEGVRTYRHVSGRVADIPIEREMSDPGDETYCVGIVQGRIPGIIPDTAREPTVADMAVTAAGVRSHIGAPLVLSDGRCFGSICAFSSQARPELDERDLKYLSSIAKLIAREVELERADAERRRADVAYIERLLEPGAVTMLYQPAFDLVDRQPIGIESLARFPDGISPTTAFPQAWRVGLGEKLETAAARQMISEIDALPAGVPISVNVSPATLASDEFFALVSPHRERIVLEITEHAAVDDYDEVRRVLGRFRELGIGIAVDDVGAGYASLSHILGLKPDFLKLDIGLVKGIGQDPARSALVTSLLAFALRLQMYLLAEGIETESDFEALRILGVRYGQGYLLGRPVRPTELFSPLASIA